MSDSLKMIGNRPETISSAPQVVGSLNPLPQRTSPDVTENTDASVRCEKWKGTVDDCSDPSPPSQPLEELPSCHAYADWGAGARGSALLA